MRDHLLIIPDVERRSLRVRVAELRGPGSSRELLGALPATLLNAFESCVSPWCQCTRSSVCRSRFLLATCRSSIAKRVLCRPFVLCVLKCGVHVGSRSPPPAGKFPFLPPLALHFRRFLSRASYQSMAQPAPSSPASPDGTADDGAFCGGTGSSDGRHAAYILLIDPPLTPACLRTLATANMRTHSPPKVRQVRATCLAGQRRCRVRAARRRPPARRLLVRPAEGRSVALCQLQR